MSELTIPGGNDKGKRVGEISDRSLQYWAQNAKQPALADACAAELRRRGAGGTQAASTPRSTQPAPTQALARAPVSSLGKAMSDPAAVTQHLQEMSGKYHLVTPQTCVDALPEGFGIAVSYVAVNPDASKDGPKEVYDVGGRLGLGMDTLKRIAAAAGIDWDPRQSGRLDSGQDPHYVHYRAVGYVRNFDGSTRTITGEVEIDARDGSPQLQEIFDKSAKSAKKYNKENDGGASQIRELRKFILRHAESKAKNRAIADMGVKRSYAPAELQKPFAVARLTFTGQSSDPELRREFARMNAERALDGVHRLYGATPPASLPAFQGHPPPPIGHVRDFDPQDFDAEGDEVPPSDRAPTAQTQAAPLVQTAAQQPNAAAFAQPAPTPAPVNDGYDNRGADPNAY